MRNRKIKLKRKINENNRNRIIIIFIILLLILSVIPISYYIYININGESKYLDIKLNGQDDIIINYKDKYIDKGANASYKKKNISKDINTKTDINFEKLGNYTYKYTIKYKKQKKSITRKVRIVDNENPVITLNDKNELSIYVGNNYVEQGAKALDNYDQDITDKIEISGNVDTDKVGEYTITYKVVDSSNNLASIERKVKVIEKPKLNQKVAVLNYHFFYEDWDSEPCHEVICEKMDTFRKQLQYLKDNNFKILTMDEFIDFMYEKIEIPEKSVLITIDDGAYGTGKHNGNHLIPVLEEYKVPATLFLITGWWDIENYRSPYLQVESHTNDLHTSGGCNATCIGYDKLVEDLRKSIDVTKSTKAFCFPFYSYSNEAIKAVKDVGFKVAFIGGNRKASRKDDKYKIPRYPIHDSTTMEQFIKMVN